jgi:DNA-nicking Smr family endonuclease
MDFGIILDRWNKTGGNAGTVYNKDAEPPFAAGPRYASIRRKRLLRKSPDAALDLHGLSRDEAWEAMAAFFDEAKRRALEKILLVHGKGNHSRTGEEPVLKRTVREFIERCPFAGESGAAASAQGGAGSTWVLLKATVPGR